MAYSIYDNGRTVESLLKEFNRTQKNIIRALRTDNQREYTKLVNYREDIRHVIKLKEQNNDTKDRKPKHNHSNTSGNISNTSRQCNRPKQTVE